MTRKPRTNRMNRMNQMNLEAPDNPEIPGYPGLPDYPGPAFITLLSHGAATCLEINADIEIQAARVGRSEVVA